MRKQLGSEIRQQMNKEILQWKRGAERKPETLITGLWRQPMGKSMKADIRDQGLLSKQTQDSTKKDASLI